MRGLPADVLDVSSVELLVAAMAARKRGQPIVFHLLDSRAWMRWPPVATLVRHLFRSVSLFVVRSPRFESHFLRWHKLIRPEARVISVPNPASREVFQHYQRRPFDGRIVLGYIGTIRGEAALRGMAQGVAQARRRGVNAQGLFAGTGPDVDIVRAFCAGQESLAYTGAFYYYQDIRSLYEKVDVVYAVYEDSEDKRIHVACRLAEAVLCGLPIIVKEGTYMAEIVREKGLGFVVPLGDGGAVAEALARLAREPALREGIKSRCRAAELTYYFEHHVEDFLKAYGKLMTPDSGLG
jgi:glycosyltransferase involved in cell wall biosynthesis